MQSCSVLLLLNDETLKSYWCLFEVNEARRHNIKIILLIDFYLVLQKIRIAFSFRYIRTG